MVIDSESEDSSAEDPDVMKETDSSKMFIITFQSAEPKMEQKKLIASVYNAFFDACYIRSCLVMLTPVHIYKHNNNEECKRILELGNREKDEALASFGRNGDYRHNMAVLAAKSEQILLQWRPTGPFKAEELPIQLRNGNDSEGKVKLSS